MVYKSDIGGRLFENSLLGQVQEEIKNGAKLRALNSINAGGNQFIFDAPAYLTSDRYREIINMAREEYMAKVTKKASLKIVEESGDIRWLYTWLLDRSVCYVIDMVKGKTFLASRNKDLVLRESAVVLKTDTTNKLYGESAIVNGCKDNNISAFRLEPAGEGKFEIKTMNRSSMQVENIGVIPVCALYEVADLISDMSMQAPLKILKVSSAGVKRYIMTVNKSILKDIYNDEDGLNYKLRCTDECGFDVMQCRLIGYDIEAPMYSPYMASVRLETIDSIRKAEPGEVDKTMLDLDVDIQKFVYASIVKGFTSEDLGHIRFIDISSYATVKDAKNALLDYGESLNGVELCKLMRSYPDVFKDVDKKVSNMKKAQPKFLKQFRDITSSVEWSDRGDALKELAKTGVLKIFARRKNGSRYEVTGTLSEDVLNRLYGGKDKWMKFESITPKLYYLKDKLNNGEDIYDSIINLGLDGVIIPESGESTAEVIDNAIEDVRSRSGNRRYDEDSLTLRLLYAKSDRDFIKSIKTSTIEKVMFTKYSSKK